MTVQVMRVSEQEFQTLNASKHAVEIPEKSGGGRIAIYEAFHLVHCVVCTEITSLIDIWPLAHSIAEIGVGGDIPRPLPQK